MLPPPEPADRVALRALDRLKEADYAGRGEFQLHYLMLTEILKGLPRGPLRHRRARAHHRRAARRPARAARPRIAPLWPTEVIRFLQQCDLVKFARFAPPTSEAADAIEQARGMVHATTTVAPTGPKEQAPQGHVLRDSAQGAGPKDRPSGTAYPPESDIPTEPVPKFKEDDQ